MNWKGWILIIFFSSLLIFGIYSAWFSEEAKLEFKLDKERKICLESFAKDYCQSINSSLSHVIATHGFWIEHFYCNHIREIGKTKFRFTEEELNKCSFGEKNE